MLKRLLIVVLIGIPIYLSRGFIDWLIPDSQNYMFWWFLPIGFLLLVWVIQGNFRAFMSREQREVYRDSGPNLFLRIVSIIVLLVVVYLLIDRFDIMSQLLEDAGFDSGFSVKGMKPVAAIIIIIVLFVWFGSRFFRPDVHPYVYNYYGSYDADHKEEQILERASRDQIENGEHLYTVNGEDWVGDRKKYIKKHFK